MEQYSELITAAVTALIGLIIRHFEKKQMKKKEKEKYYTTKI